VTNTNLPPILHLLKVKNRYIWLYLAFKPQTEVFSWDDLRNIFRGCQ